MTSDEQKNRAVTSDQQETKILTASSSSLVPALRDHSSLLLSAFLGSDREKGREFLLNLFALAFWAGHFPFVVLGQCHDQGESLLASLAGIFVLGHSTYPPISLVMILAEKKSEVRSQNAVASDQWLVLLR